MTGDLVEGQIRNNAKKKLASEVKPKETKKNFPITRDAEVARKTRRLATTEREKRRKQRVGARGIPLHLLSEAAGIDVTVLGRAPLAFGVLWRAPYAFGVRSVVL